jgi:hypothetical protein
LIELTSIFGIETLKIMPVESIAPGWSRTVQLPSARITFCGFSVPIAAPLSGSNAAATPGGGS